MTMARNKFAFLTAGLVLAILTLTNCGEVACDPTRDSWCEENDSSSSIGGGSSSSGGGLPLSSNGGNSSSSVGGGSSSSGGGLPLFEYLSCDELGKLMQSGFNIDAVKEECKTKSMTKIREQCLSKPNEAEIDKCARNIVMACMSEDKDFKQLCGGNDLETCQNHYETDCKSSSSVGGGSSSSVGGGNVVHGEPVNYGGETYPTVVIGTQTWFAKNLNYNAEGSKCYDNDPANCTKYGRLYDWSTAMGFSSNCNSSTCSDQIQPKHRGICPTGWHIPSNTDWEDLMTTVGGENTAGTKLKATSDWNSGGNGTDNYGFSALPGGNGYSDGSFYSFYSVGIIGFWWSASELEDYSDDAYGRFMDYGIGRAGWRSYGKVYLISVRCLQD